MAPRSSNRFIKSKNYYQKQDAIKDKRVYSNSEKKKIAKEILERYTGHSISQFQKQIILTNFPYYTQRFNELIDDADFTVGSAFKASSSKKYNVTIIEFGIGSAMAALIVEVLSVVNPRAVLFLGMCGGLHKKLKIGDFILPLASIRAEGVSMHFMPSQVPALPTFEIQKYISEVLVSNNFDYKTGTIHSTDLRFWEFDKNYKNKLYEERALGIEMETAALFTAGFASKVPIGALLLVSDMPLMKGGVKTKKSSSKVFRQFTDSHIELGIEIMSQINESGELSRHFKW